MDQGIYEHLRQNDTWCMINCLPDVRVKNIKSVGRWLGPPGPDKAVARKKISSHGGWRPGSEWYGNDIPCKTIERTGDTMAACGSTGNGPGSSWYIRNEILINERLSCCCYYVTVVVLQTLALLQYQHFEYTPTCCWMLNAWALLCGVLHLCWTLPNAYLVLCGVSHVLSRPT